MEACSLFSDPIVPTLSHHSPGILRPDSLPLAHSTMARVCLEHTG